jgi:hypothetical protein
MLERHAFASACFGLKLKGVRKREQRLSFPQATSK